MTGALETANPAILAEQAARPTPVAQRCDACVAGDCESCDAVVCRGCDHGGLTLRKHGLFGGSNGLQGGSRR